MKLYINEKLFSLHNKYNILDESGRNKYYIKNKLFTIAKKTYMI